jgi:(p)ppGpp synthase/HD superfamily hydrolase
MSRLEAPELILSRSALLRRVYDFAAEAHAGQRLESDGSPYIDHVVAVARLLQRGGCSDAVVAAGLLHDTVERSNVKIADLERRFGPEVANLVTAMTEPNRPPDFRARKAAHRMQIAGSGSDAAAIFAADKIAGVQSLRGALAHGGEESVGGRLSKPLDQKVEHYRKTLEMLEQLERPGSLVPMLRRELDSLDLTRSRAVDATA